jgi:hypothetical protein
MRREEENQSLTSNVEGQSVFVPDSGNLFLLLLIKEGRRRCFAVEKKKLRNENKEDLISFFSLNKERD